VVSAVVPAKGSVSKVKVDADAVLPINEETRVTQVAMNKRMSDSLPAIIGKGLEIFPTRRRFVGPGAGRP
jgi:hypothetical protein